MHNLEIERGKSIAISTDYAVKRISVGAPEILDVVAIGTKDIQLVAKSIGITNVLLWDTKGRPQAIIEVHVGTPYTHVERTIRRIMQNDSILVEGAGNAVILRGNVSSSVGLDQVLKLAHGMIEVGEGEDTPQVVNLIEVGGNHQVMLSVIVAEMSRKLKRSLVRTLPP